MPESSEDGHFRRTLRIDRSLAAQHSNDGWLAFDVPLPAGRRDSFKGRIRLRPPTGVTVISDVDDTVKISEVTDKKRLIANTFLKEFQAAAGMAELYRSWEKRGADLTFVSASPWQLYPALSSWMDAEEFPPAAFNLRQIRFRDSSLTKLFDDPFKSKVTRISTILKRFPRRKFILVGDSGEKDPEVYGELARRFPKQVVSSLIRTVTGESRTAGRMKKAFRKVPAQSWQIFEKPGEIRLPDGIFKSPAK
jgi:phosphatidate phosphatase APP1